MNSNSSQRVDPGMLAALRERLPEGADQMTLESFIDCALYHPCEGYYSRRMERVGRSPQTDFYTASSLGSVFSQLVLASIGNLLPEPFSEYTFIELGPESAGGILAHIEDIPFAAIRLVRPGLDLKIPQKAVVFSNEVFDAQPFRRFIRTGGVWRETGVRIRQDQLEWTLLDPVQDLPELPPDAPEGYHIDWPGSAHALLDKICRQPWEGLFLAFDYGLSRQSVFTERPAGTGRTYSEHTMGDDLIANPGRIDITCHMIWDELEHILRRHRFEQVRVLHQEAFFMHHSMDAVENIMAAEPAGFSRARQTLKELLHPGNMGHKFQVLSGYRPQL